MSVLDEIGYDTFSVRFRHCFFNGPEEKPCVITGASVDRVSAQEVSIGKDNVISFKEITIPKDFFSSFKFLRTPPLGYRHSHRGMYLSWWSRNNTTYTRGVCANNLVVTNMQHTDMLLRMGKLTRSKVTSPAFLAYNTLRPNFLSIEEGIELLNTGKILSFANTEEIAVVPETDDTYSVYLQNVKVGHFTPEKEYIPLSDDTSDLEFYYDQRS